MMRSGTDILPFWRKASSSISDNALARQRIIDGANDGFRALIRKLLVCLETRLTASTLNIAGSGSVNQ